MEKIKKKLEEGMNKVKTKFEKVTNSTKDMVSNRGIRKEYALKSELELNKDLLVFLESKFPIGKRYFVEEKLTLELIELHEEIFLEVFNIESDVPSFRVNKYHSTVAQLISAKPNKEELASFIKSVKEDIKLLEADLEAGREDTIVLSEDKTVKDIAEEILNKISANNPDIKKLHINLFLKETAYKKFQDANKFVINDDTPMKEIVENILKDNGMEVNEENISEINEYLDEAIETYIDRAIAKGSSTTDETIEESIENSITREEESIEKEEELEEQDNEDEEIKEVDESEFTEVEGAEEENELLQKHLEETKKEEEPKVVVVEEKKDETKVEPPKAVKDENEEDDKDIDFDNFNIKNVRKNTGRRVRRSLVEFVVENHKEEIDVTFLNKLNLNELKILAPLMGVNPSPSVKYKELQQMIVMDRSDRK